MFSKKKPDKPNPSKRRKGRETGDDDEVVSVAEVFAEHTPQSPDGIPERVPRGRAAILHPEEDAWSAT